MGAKTDYVAELERMVAEQSEAGEMPLDLLAAWRVELKQAKAGGAISLATKLTIDAVVAAREGRRGDAALAIASAAEMAEHDGAANEADRIRGVLKRAGQGDA
ncbi:MAG: hypothetical protein IPJ34_22540 [Myxococcales bacterium]|nr:hypothetical protein [Myxococcales bacterium]